MHRRMSVPLAALPSSAGAAAEFVRLALLQELIAFRIVIVPEIAINEAVDLNITMVGPDVGV
jgi:hypothetical protein